MGRVCLLFLLKLAEFNRSQLIWSPRHRRIEGNEISYSLGKSLEVQLQDLNWHVLYQIDTLGMSQGTGLSKDALNTASPLLDRGM